MPDSNQAATPAAEELTLYTIAEVATMLRLGRTVIFELLRNGRLASVREGRARRIPATAVADYIKLLKREAAERNAA